MNYFVEGLQGSGKSTFTQTLARLCPEARVYHEGDYSPTELAWCAYMSEQQYDAVLAKYSEIADEIRAKTFEEDRILEGGEKEVRKIVCYTRIMTDIPGFHKDLEQYEIYNNRVPLEEFKKIILSRYAAWKGDSELFECSIFQNIVEDMTLFKNLSDEEIIDFYKEVKKALSDRNFKILYLYADDVEGNLNVIRKERSDEDGNELWFPLMMGFFDESPYAKARGVSGEKALIEHFKHRQELEVRIGKEVFAEAFCLLRSKGYTEEEVKKVGFTVLHEYEGGLIMGKESGK